MIELPIHIHHYLIEDQDRLKTIGTDKHQYFFNFLLIFDKFQKQLIAAGNINSYYLSQLFSLIEPFVKYVVLTEKLSNYYQSYPQKT